MPETIVLLDMTTPERADRLRALLPDGFVLTHGTARGDDAGNPMGQPPPNAKWAAASTRSLTTALAVASRPAPRP